MTFEVAPDLNKVFVRPLHIKELLAMYAGNTEITDPLNTILADLNERVTAGHAASGEGEIPVITVFAARTETDGKCLGEGWFSKKEITGDDADLETKVLCDGCGAWGKSTAANTPTKTWSNYEPPKSEA